MKQLSIIIVTYESGDVLPNLLNSLKDQDLASEQFEVIVVDNGTGPEVDRLIPVHFPQASLLKNVKNIGFAAAANMGARRATGEYLLFLNPDVVLMDRRFLTVFLNRGFENSSAILAPQLLFPDGRSQPSFWRRPGLTTLACEMLLPQFLASMLVTVRPGSPEPVGSVSGACLLVPGETFWRLGGFDERFFMYYEDADLCLRASKGGCRVLASPDLFVVHHLATSSWKDMDRFFLHYYGSKLIYFRKHHPPRRAAIASWLISMGLLLRWVVIALVGGLLRSESSRVRSNLFREVRRRLFADSGPL